MNNNTSLPQYEQLDTNSKKEQPPRKNSSNKTPIKSTKSLKNTVRKNKFQSDKTLSSPQTQLKQMKSLSPIKEGINVNLEIKKTEKKKKKKTKKKSDLVLPIINHPGVVQNPEMNNFHQAAKVPTDQIIKEKTSKKIKENDISIKSKAQTDNFVSSTGVNYGSNVNRVLKAVNSKSSSSNTIDYSSSLKIEKENKKSSLINSMSLSNANASLTTQLKSQNPKLNITATKSPMRSSTSTNIANFYSKNTKVNTIGTNRDNSRDNFTRNNQHANTLKESKVFDKKETVVQVNNHSQLSRSNVFSSSLKEKEKDKRDKTSTSPKLKSNNLLESPMMKNYSSKGNRKRTTTTTKDLSNNSNLSTGSSNNSLQQSTNAKQFLSSKEVLNISTKASLPNSINPIIREFHENNVIAEVNEKSFDDGDVLFNKTKNAFGVNKEKKHPVFKVSEKINYYVICPGNNSALVKKCMEHRSNWRECNSLVTTVYNFKWKETSTGIDFGGMNKLPSLRQMINHFEFHNSISNKLNLFINMMYYCEKKGLDVFKYIPFTIIFQYDSSGFLSQFDNFTTMFHNINDYVNFSDDPIELPGVSNSNVANKKSPKKGEKKIPRYNYLFSTGVDKMGSRTPALIPYNYYQGKNFWLVKAANQNRGKCIKVLENINLIHKTIKRFYEGVCSKFQESEVELKELMEEEIREKQTRDNRDLSVKDALNDRKKEYRYRDYTKEFRDMKENSKSQKDLKIPKDRSIVTNIKTVNKDEVIGMVIPASSTTLASVNQPEANHIQVVASNTSEARPAEDNLIFLQNVNNNEVIDELLNPSSNTNGGEQVEPNTNELIGNRGVAEAVPEVIGEINSPITSNNINKMKKPCTLRKSNNLDNSQPCDFSTSNNNLLINNSPLVAEHITLPQSDMLPLQNNIDNVRQEEVKEDTKNTAEKVLSGSSQQQANTASASDKKKNLEEKRLKLLKDKYKASEILVQKYLESPLLYKGRKFDIRVWVLVTHKMEVFMFKQGHLKTSSVNYELDKLDSFIHITNYSVQKYNENFSKFDIGNEVSFQDFQIELDRISKERRKTLTVEKDVIPQIHELIKLSFKAVKYKLNMNDRKFCFEIFGYDFILDYDLNCFLLEVNTNPGLEESSPLIKEIVPRMIDDCLRITIDTAFDTKYNFANIAVNRESANANVNSNIVNPLPSSEAIQEIAVLNNEATIGQSPNYPHKVTKDNYTSPFPVKGYDDSENLWEYIFNMSEKEANEPYESKRNRAFLPFNY